MKTNKVTITVTGPVGSGRSTLLAKIKTLLNKEDIEFNSIGEHGIEVDVREILRKLPK